jgi:hypothetical protein
MKITINLKAAAFAVALNIPAVLTAADPSKCDEIANRVREAVEKQPKKVLVTVEDFMVSNEACAREIVRAAVQASKASPDLVQQIVATATNVAPKYAKVIADSAAATAVPAVASNTSSDATYDGKDIVGSGNGKDVSGVQPVTPPMEGVQPVASGSAESGSDYRAAPSDIRGVYLIQPATSGVVTTSNTPESPTTSTKVVVKRTPPKRSVPQSPSVATGP